MELDGATFLVQWAAGGMLFAWVTTRRREVSLGYGWLLRGIYATFAIGALGLWVGGAERAMGEVALAGAFVVVCVGGVVTSVVRRHVGVSGARADRARRSERVAAMVGAEPATTDESPTGPEFDPRWDLAAAAVGFAATISAALADSAGGLDLARLVVGAAFLGAVSDAMLLGHWYLTQPGLGREPLKELVRLLAWLWPIEVALFLIPDGMVQVLTGAIDDGWDGLLGWIWLVSALTTIVLCGVTWAALKERYYSAVMAATGLLYLAILTAFGTDLVARAVLGG
jgi:hypothetical protein